MKSIPPAYTPVPSNQKSSPYTDRPRRTSYLLLPFLLLLCLGCSKTEELSESEIKVITVGNQPITTLLLLDSTLIACEASSNHSGTIYQSSTPYTLWEKKAYDKEHPFYALSLQPKNNTLWAAGDYLTIYKKDRSTNWQFVPLWDQVPTNEFDRPPFRKWVWQSDSCAVAVAGEYYKKGVLYFTKDGGATWSFTFFPNELATVAIDSSGIGFAAGYGILLRIDSRIASYQQCPTRGFYITDIHCTYKGLFYYATWQGEIGTLSPNGELQPIYKSSYRFNKLVSIGETLYAIANDGVLVSGKPGQLKPLLLPGKENLLDIAFNHNQTKVYIATQKGRVLQLEVGDL